MTASVLLFFLLLEVTYVSSGASFPLVGLEAVKVEMFTYPASVRIKAASKKRQPRTLGVSCLKQHDAHDGSHLCRHPTSEALLDTMFCTQSEAAN